MFQIDPATKRNWIPAGKHALTVSYFYDATRNVYRIISIGGAKVLAGLGWGWQAPEVSEAGLGLVITLLCAWGLGIGRSP